MSKAHPQDEIRIGHIKAAIWKNETDTGTRYNVTVTRLYKDGTDWKYSDSFGRDDLLVLAKLLDRAHDRIFELQAQDSDNAG